MTERDLEELTIARISPQIRSGKLSPLELTDLFLDRIKRLNPALNAYVTLTEGQAIADAKMAEKEIHRGKYRGPLHGIPFSIKDNLVTKGVRTTAGSKILSEWVPDFDATVVTRLREAGAVILGKTNMHEWAGGGTTINPYYGTTCNPWDAKRISGGSSGGSAAAVAASMCLASIGTDNAGSVRNPASLCGVVGLKATHGRVSRFGGVPGTGGYSTDHFGIFTKTVEDCALVLKVIAGGDPKDPLSSDEPVADYSKSIGAKIKGPKLGVIRGYFDDLMTDEVKNALDEAIGVLESLGIKKEEVSIPHMDLIPAVQTATSRVENVATQDHYLRTRPRDYSPELLYRHICSLMIPAATYVTAQRVRRLICQEFEEAFNRVQVIVAPTTPMPAPTIEECRRGFIEADGRRINLSDFRGSFGTRCTHPFNTTGHPAISVCCGFSSNGLPIGMQIVADYFKEGLVFQVAHAYERAAQWYKRKPQLP
jgi:aspartyl-tRNA(Asn)/glutamyl-tRNA(Gln) amidotransferase subunit A